MLGLTGLKLYGAIGAALALLALLGTVKVQHGTIGKLRETNGVLQAQRDQVFIANQGQAAAIDQCQQANAQWLSLGKGVAELKADLAALDKARTERDAANRLLAERRQNASVPCKAILATDLTGVCGPLVDSLRERASENH